MFFLEARRRKLATHGFGWLAIAGLCGGVLGARLAMLLTDARVLATAPLLGGKAFFGGIIGGWLGVELMKRRLGIRRRSGDLFALALPAGEAVGRIGCFFNGCCYGTVCDARWAIYQHGAWRHPAQFYAAGIALFIFLALLTLRDKLAQEGELFLAYLLLFGVGRFVLEFFRERDIVWNGLSLMQIISLLLVAYASRELLKKRAAPPLPKVELSKEPTT